MVQQLCVPDNFTGSVFVGGTCVISLQQPLLLGALDNKHEGLLLVNVTS